MKFGVFTDFHLKDGESQAQAFADGFEQVDVLEEIGIGEIWLPELHFYYERSVACSPTMLGTAIAGRTTKARIGLAVQVLPLGNPRLAMAESTLGETLVGRGMFAEAEPLLLEAHYLRVFFSATFALAPGFAAAPMNFNCMSGFFSMNS